MDYFEPRDGVLCAEQVPLTTVAESVGTPAFVYSAGTIRLHVERLREAWAPVNPAIRYAVKANGNLALLQLLREAGVGFDVVSRGEIDRALRAGADADTIDFAGVGKRRDEIEHALEVGVGTFNVESAEELELLGEIARAADRTASVALRVNPDVDPRTHRHITTGLRENKFGVDPETARELAASMSERPGLRLHGLHLHIGSQMTDVEPFREAIRRGVALAGELRADGVDLRHLNLGGGFGIHYREQEAPSIDAFANAAAEALGDVDLEIRIEPGRLIVGNAGVLITRVLYVKKGRQRRFVICDAGMTELIRPSLYDAYHRIEPVEPRPGPTAPVDVVGPVCETTDTFARDRELPAVEPGDLLCIRSAGAYGSVLSSHYNARPRAPEVLVDGDRVRVIRERETFEDLVRGEHLESRWL